MLCGCPLPGWAPWRLLLLLLLLLLVPVLLLSSRYGCCPWRAPRLLRLLVPVLSARLVAVGVGGASSAAPPPLATFP